MTFLRLLTQKNMHQNRMSLKEQGVPELFTDDVDA